MCICSFWCFNLLLTLYSLNVREFLENLAQLPKDIIICEHPSLGNADDFFRGECRPNVLRWETVPTHNDFFLQKYVIHIPHV